MYHIQYFESFLCFFIVLLFNSTSRIFLNYGYAADPPPHLPPLPLSELAIFTWKVLTMLKQMKNQCFDFSDFYLLRYGWLYLQFKVTHLHFQACHQSNNKKKSFKSGQIYRKDAQCSENYFLVHEFFFCEHLMYLNLMYLSTSCT